MRNSSALLLLCVALFSIDSAADEHRWNYSLGFSLKQLSLDVYKAGKTDPEGVLTDELTLYPDIGLESSITYFSDSSWGYKYALNFGHFKMSTQEVDSQDKHLGTSASGQFIYAMPVAVYDFNKHSSNSSLLLGFGVGIGYLNASGTIIFTEANPQTRHRFNLAQLTYAFGLFFEHTINTWSYGVSLYGPEISKGGYEYNLFDMGVTLRKKFSF